MKKLMFVLVFLAGCATATQPPAVNVRDGRGYCPLCVEWHEDGQMRWPTEYAGRTYRFCDPNCRAAFVKNPEKYLKDPQFNPAGGNSGTK
jgi:YHS domain-containing protein